MHLSPFIQTLGRSHVVIVHFPIALLILAAMIEAWRGLRRQKEIAPASWTCLGFGMFFGVMAILFGFFHKHYSSFDGDSASVLAWHQWLGISAVAIAFLAAATQQRVGIIVAAILVGITGHFGGTLTHGEGYLTELIFGGKSQEIVLAPTTQPSTGKIDFVRDVQPILQSNCYDCHGPDKRKGNLRLDAKALALKGGNSGPLLIAGKPKDSLIIKRVLGQGGDKRMPIDHPPLTQQQIGTLVAWIDSGAVWPDDGKKVVDEVHWAYTPTTRPAVPAVKNASWPRNEIDRFVLAKLESDKLSRSPEADRRTLIRRVTLDLTGLPPTPDEVEAFVNDKSPDAYERVIDRLLASPHYGERMAVYWLDLVRFGDTLGVHSDTQIMITPYRDWVIKAFNNDEHFDQFTIEQLAGDFLPNPTLDQRVATAYNRCLITSEEGGAQPREYIAKYAADRVRNIAGVWLGSTMQCCECHNHKYDPFTIKDFYRMEAFFADVQDNPVGKYARVGEIRVPNDRQQADIAVENAEIVKLRAKLDVTTPELEAAQVKWEEFVRRNVNWRILQPTNLSSDAGTKLVVLPDGSVIAGGPRADKDNYTFTAPLPGKVTAIKIEMLPDISFPAQGPGRFDNGNFVLTKLSVSVTPAGKDSPVTPVRLANASADYQPDQQLIADSINPTLQPPKGWAIQPQFGKPHVAIVETIGDVDANGQITIHLGQQFGMGHLIGRFRISVTDAERPIGVGKVSPNIEKIVKTVPPMKRNNKQRNAVLAYYRSISPLLDASRAELAKHEAKKNEILGGCRLCETTLEEPTPRVIKVLARGNWLDDSGEVVTPAVPGFMKQLDVGDRRANRMDLAKWLVSGQNPLTARVFVNRLWMLYFGTGISKTVDDFGNMGETPVNPQLLDWMASEFVASHWDVKHMIRLIVTSSAYRQSSDGSKELRERDPFNRLIARQSSIRLDAEFIRDNALAIGGILSPAIGGESGHPYQPDGYWDFLNFPKRTYPTDHGYMGHRRGVYTWWQRTFVHPFLLAFDASTRAECVAQRAKSNTPLQALDLLNDPTFVEASRCFAQRILIDGGSTTTDRLNYAFRRALARTPTADEAKVLENVLEKHSQEYKADPKAAEALVKIGDEGVPDKLNKSELAAWTNVARVIMNLHETINRL